MQKEEFLFRKSFYEICQEIQDPLLRVAVYDIICEYGVTEESRLSEYPVTEEQRQLIQAIVNPIFSSIDGTKRRYQRAVENGRKGGLMGGRGNKKNKNEEERNNVNDAH